MSLKAGRRGLKKRLVDAFGNLKGETPSGDYYTKQQTDDKFETKTHATSTYASKTDVEPVIYTYTGDNTKTWADFLSGLLSEISDINDVLSSIEAGKHIFLEFLSKTNGNVISRSILQLVSANNTELTFTHFTSNANIEFSECMWLKVKWGISGTATTYVKDGKIYTNGAASETDVTNNFPFYSGSAPSSKSGVLMLVIK